MYKKIAIGISGSFCNHQIAIDEIQHFVDEGYDVTCFLTDNVNTMSTKFGDKNDLKDLIFKITGKVAVATIQEAEYLVGEKRFDHMLIMPCSASTLGKLVNGIYDNAVLMCAKSLMRNDLVVVLAIATNDGLGISGVNIMKANNYKQIYLVPLRQDNYIMKPHSLIFEKSLVLKAVEEAYNKKQIQPLFLEGKGI